MATSQTTADEVANDLADAGFEPSVASNRMRNDGGTTVIFDRVHIDSIDDDREAAKEIKDEAKDAIQRPVRLVRSCPNGFTTHYHIHVDIPTDTR